MYEELVNVYRGKLVESIHNGAIAVVAPNGEILASVGQPEQKTYWRSAAKPIQAIPLIADGVADYYGLTDREIAVISASHSGEDLHIELVRSILDKIGLDESALKCGTHYPYNKKAKEKLVSAGKEPTEIYNNCSGKHSGLLALCQYNDWNIENYFALEHPLQQVLLKYIALMTGVKKEKIVTGEDGCGVVVYGLPITSMARAYARLANPEYLPADLEPAAARIRDAMIKNPEAVGGTGRFNTDLMAAAGDYLVAKVGAEGIFSLGIKGGPGITIKIGDGNKRAIPPVIMKLLAEFIDLSKEELDSLSEYQEPSVTNHRDHKVGKIIPTFKLNNIGKVGGENIASN
ncbi:MAG: asparaginase [Bacillota bacterium]